MSRVNEAVGHGVALAVSCGISYWLINQALARAYFISREDGLLGGMWAVIATIFVYRHCYQQSAHAAILRVAATLVSFVLCLGYLLIFSFHPWGMATVIGIGAMVMSLIGRPEDIITIGITTAVVMVVAGISPQHAWRQPIFRLVDTVVGTAVGLSASLIGQSLVGRSPKQVTEKGVHR